jgi:hypothetical protein
MLSGTDTLENTTNSAYQTGLSSADVATSAEVSPVEREQSTNYAPPHQPAKLQDTQRLPQQADPSTLNQDFSYLDGFDFTGFENMDFANGINTLQQGKLAHRGLLTTAFDIVVTDTNASTKPCFPLPPWRPPTPIG